MCDNRANVGQVRGDSIDLPSALREIERLHNHEQTLAARIKVLEDALARIISEAKDVKKAMEEPNPAIVDTIFVTEIGTAVDYLDTIISIAEDKIGGGDMPITEIQDKIVQGLDLCHDEIKKQIEESNRFAEECALQQKRLLSAEQREALEYAIDNIDPCPTIYIDAIRDLLSGSKPSWEATEERIKAIAQAAHICHEITAFDSANVLRAMLEEVK